MARLVPAKCPQCAAGVNVDPDQEVVRCDYCGTTSFVERPKRQAPPNMPVVHLPPQPSAGGGMAAVLIIGAMVAMVGAGALFFGTKASRPDPELADVEATDGAPKPTRPTKEAPKITVSDRLPQIADANGDGVPDVILRIRRDHQEEHAAYDPKAGKVLWSIPAKRAESAVAAGRLFEVDGKGQVTAYLLSNGKRQWTTSLGEKLKSFCRGDDKSLLVLTAADEVKRLDAASGGQETEAADKCVIMRGAARGMMPFGVHNPRDRRDYEAPEGVEGFVCGSVRVSGSANYFVPDRCGKEGVGFDALDGMAASRLWRDGDGYIVLGHKKPGTRTPMVGRAKARQKKPVWSSVVPTGNPLDATPSAPRAATVSGNLLVVSWSKGVTAFDKNTGDRKWTTKGEAKALITAGSYVIAWRGGAGSGGSMSVLDPKTGKERHRLGE